MTPPKVKIRSRNNYRRKKGIPVEAGLYPDKRTDVYTLRLTGDDRRLLMRVKGSRTAKGAILEGLRMLECLGDVI